MFVSLGLAGVAVAAAAFAQEAPPDYSQDTAWHNRQQAALASLKQSDGWRHEARNLRWRYISGSGAGKRPSLRDRVTVHYTGSFIDGTEFDSSYASGKPVTFPLGRLVKAWQVAIPKMAVGDTIEIAAPADLAYGPRGKGPIPGGATLMFKVELLDIE
ncbi:hypothetical protein GCM10022213_19520 [Parerythrobacter jejuensis]